MTPRNPSNRSAGGRPGGRQLPKRPGDTSSTTRLSINDDDEDSDSSEYNYQAYYASQNNQTNSNSNYQNSDDDRSEYGGGGGGGAGGHRLSTSNYNESSNDTVSQYNDKTSNQPNHHQQLRNVNDDDDDDDEADEPLASGSKHRGGKSRSKTNQETLEEQQNAAAAAALIAQQNEALKELEIHKKRLQIYVFVCRCIAYPFIAKQPTDMVRRQMKITKQQLQSIKDNFDAFLQAKMNIEADEAFTNAVRSYFEVFLKSDRIAKMVQAGGCSASDFRDVFKNNIEKRVRSLPEIDGLSKETVLTSWMTKFDTIFRYNEDAHTANSIASRRHSRNNANLNSSSECILSKEQLYDMFQNILGVKKFEHQLIFNAAQVM